MIESCLTFIAEIESFTKETLISHTNDTIFIPTFAAYNSVIDKNWFRFFLKLEVEDTALPFLFCSLLYFNHCWLNFWFRFLLNNFFFHLLVFLTDFFLHQLSNSLFQLTRCKSFLLLQLACYDVWVHRNLNIWDFILCLRLLNLNFYFFRYNLNMFYLRFYFLDDFHILFLYFYLRLWNLLFVLMRYLNLNSFLFLGFDIIEDLFTGVFLRFFFFD